MASSSSVYAPPNPAVFASGSHATSSTTGILLNEAEHSLFAIPFEPFDESGGESMGQRNGRYDRFTDSPRSPRTQRDRARPYARPSVRNAHHTENRGDYNQTYNRSRGTDSASPPSISTASSSSHVHASPSPPTSASSPQARGPKESLEEKTQSQRYESFLLGCQLGNPLWRPGPRRTLDEEYMPEIGAVGFFSDGLPFNTLFNISLPLDNAANKDGVPDGVDPPCTIQRRWLSVHDQYHQKETTLFRPKGVITRQRVQARNGSSLSQQEGAMLMLPKGGTLYNLDQTSHFKDRIKYNWRSWYAFANDQGDLGDQETLCLVTGVERCSTWAMAVWDEDSSGDHDDHLQAPLELTVDQLHGGCSWEFPPARCTTQSSVPDPLDQSKETVFVRGFWVNRSDGEIGPRPPTVHVRGDENIDGHDESMGGGEEHSRNPYSSSDSTSKSSFSAQPSAGGGYSRSSDSHSDSTDLPDGSQTTELNLYLSVTDLDDVDYPCQVINKFALALMSGTALELPDDGCIAISHDSDWMSAMQDSEEGFPSKSEFIRRICSRTRFVVEKDVIYTESLSDQEAELLHKSEPSTQQRDCGCPIFQAYVHFADLEPALVDDAGDVSTTTDIPSSAPERLISNGLVEPPSPSLISLSCAPAEHDSMAARAGQFFSMEEGLTFSLPSFADFQSIAVFNGQANSLHDVAPHRISRDGLASFMLSPYIQGSPLHLSPFARTLETSERRSLSPDKFVSLMSSSVPQSPIERHHTLEGQIQLFKEAEELPFSVPGSFLIPQAIYRPLNRRINVVQSSAHVNGLGLDSPIYFWVENPAECGLSLIDALHGRLERFPGREDTVFEARGPTTISIRLEWPGYQPWNRQIPTRDFCTPPRPITKAKLAKNVAKCVQRFIVERQGRQMEKESDEKYRVGTGTGTIRLEDLVVVSLHHVSAGSWQPQLRVCPSSSASTR
ncbi:hypothetical protein V5O48_014672 [Marasmius crinis-equi]|uniref:Uncharacterized protein n=1 Tax=Marasmius crinis-equi TaxID=585013 RepID=A0ABR3EWN0_9AGAR